MAGVIDTPILSLSSKAVSFYKAKVPNLWSRVALGAILLLSAFMNFFLLGQNGYGNFYYAAGVRSMLDSWRNFFFFSFDPGGFVSIDKPPLGFWLQALSAKIFGFTPFSLFLPQAICGVLAVALLYYLVRRHFGEMAGLIAALVLAVTPISVLTNRNNTIDGTLALVLLLAAWALIHAAEMGKLRWLLLSSVFVGIGFNIKMAEAYLVLPALALTYLLCAPLEIQTRVRHLLLALGVMLVVSLSWTIAVDLTPVTQRPYVGSTPDNSALFLALGYNGVGRLRIGGINSAGHVSTLDIVHEVILQLTQPNPLRLFTITLGGQIAWLLPLALLGIVALVWQRRFNFQKDRLSLGLVLWSGWLLTMAAFFTLDASFHEYYMTVMAPGLSALAGIGLVVMWHDYRSSGWRGWFLPFALITTAVAQILMLTLYYPTWSRWLSPLIIILADLVVIVLLLLRFRMRRLGLHGFMFRIAGPLVSAGLLALLLAPVVWSGYTVIHNTEGAFPTAGPPVSSGNGSPASGNVTVRSTGIPKKKLDGPALIAYLEARQGNTKFLVATIGNVTAAPIILSTNKPVMAMGGYSGNDPILTPSTLQGLVRKGAVRFFLVDPLVVAQGQAMVHHTRLAVPPTQNYSVTTQVLLAWVGDHCPSVAVSGSNQLYDCSAPRIPSTRPSKNRARTRPTST